MYGYKHKKMLSYFKFKFKISLMDAVVWERM